MWCHALARWPLTKGVKDGKSISWVWPGVIVPINLVNSRASTPTEGNAGYNQVAFAVGFPVASGGRDVFELLVLRAGVLPRRIGQTGGV